MLLLFIVCTDFTLHTILPYLITLRLDTVKIAPSSDYITGLNNSQDRLISFMPHTTSLSFGQSHAQEKAGTARLLRQITAKFVNSRFPSAVYNAVHNPSFCFRQAQRIAGIILAELNIDRLPHNTVYIYYVRYIAYIQYVRR
jgi:hypothetical protein